ncbi:MAG: TraB/GumN family protein [Sphingomonas sp.]
MPKFLPRVFAALALLLVPAAHAQEVQDADPALWVVKDADTTIYLFGTVHILRPGLSWFDDGVKQAFDASGEVVLEMLEPEGPAAQALMLGAAMSSDGRKLSDRIPEDKREAFLAGLAQAHVAPALLDPYDPWFASVNLTIATLMAHGFDPASGAEPTITAAAKAAGKRLVGFETMEEQLGFFERLSEQAQVAMLLSTLAELPGLDATIGKMVADWSRGDADAIAAMLNENLVDSPETMKTLLTDRNARWADRIADWMKQPGTIFIAVGAGHLAGTNSVQAYLAGHDLHAERVQY